MYRIPTLPLNVPTDISNLKAVIEESFEDNSDADDLFADFEGGVDAEAELPLHPNFRGETTHSLDLQHSLA